MGIFDKIKIVEPKEDQQQIKAQQHAAKIQEMWEWLRGCLDLGAESYQLKNDDSQLRECLSGKALEEVIKYLDQLKVNNVLWRYPDRDKRSDSKLVVDKIIGGTTFEVTEHFYDYSRLDYIVNNNIAQTKFADGSRKMLKATIQANKNEDIYFITNVVMINQ